jgi:glycosyltransferase involved in cell wall biosynthesis
MFDYYSINGIILAVNAVKDKILKKEGLWNSNRSINYPLNEEIITHSKGLIVHSAFIKNKILEKFNKPVAKINMHACCSEEWNTQKIRKQLGFSSKDFIICSVGFININKRYDLIVPAISELAAENKNIKYIILGEDHSNLLHALTKPENKNIICKGYLPLKDVEKHIAASDICINLRYPTMGESSASMLRMFSYSKPVLVSEAGAHAELPDFAIKIKPGKNEKQEIKNKIRMLINNPRIRKELGKKAKEYAKKECSIEKCAKEYALFIKKVIKTK